MWKTPDFCLASVHIHTHTQNIHELDHIQEKEFSVVGGDPVKFYFLPYFLIYV